MTIIAFTGKAGSGKDTAANILIEQFNFIKISFAASLKDALAAIFSWPRDMLEGATAESRAWREQKDEWWSNRLCMNITPRHILQTWGTELCRDGFHEDIWIASLEKKLLSFPATTNIVITDCRFENEAAIIHKLGGKIIQIDRSNTSINSDSKHSSELGLSESTTDVIIHNKGTLEEFEFAIKCMIEPIFKN
jgi:hypothetical protein